MYFGKRFGRFFLFVARELLWDARTILSDSAGLKRLENLEKFRQPSRNSLTSCAANVYLGLEYELETLQRGFYCRYMHDIFVDLLILSMRAKLTVSMDSIWIQRFVFYEFFVFLFFFFYRSLCFRNFRLRISMNEIVFFFFFVTLRRFDIFNFKVTKKFHLFENLYAFI